MFRICVFHQHSQSCSDALCSFVLCLSALKLLSCNIWLNFFANCLAHLVGHDPPQVWLDSLMNKFWLVWTGMLNEGYLCSNDIDGCHSKVVKEHNNFAKVCGKHNSTSGQSLTRTKTSEIPAVTVKHVPKRKCHRQPPTTNMNEINVMNATNALIDNDTDKHECDKHEWD